MRELTLKDIIPNFLYKKYLSLSDHDKVRHHNDYEKTETQTILTFRGCHDCDCMTTQSYREDEYCFFYECEACGHIDVIEEKKEAKGGIA